MENTAMKKPFTEYWTQPRLHKAVLSGKRPSLDGVPVDIAALLSRCWSTNPSESWPTFSDIYNELKNPRYFKIFGSTESEVNKYIDFLERKPILIEQPSHRFRVNMVANITYFKESSIILEMVIRKVSLNEESFLSLHLLFSMINQNISQEMPLILRVLICFLNH